MPWEGAKDPVPSNISANPNAPDGNEIENETTDEETDDAETEEK